MSLQAVVAFAAYWITLMVSAYLGSGLTFYLVALPAIAFGVWEAVGYVREKLVYDERPSEAFARAARHASLDAELHFEGANVSHNWVASDWKLLGSREPYATEERCTRCKALVKFPQRGDKSSPCWAHPNYQPTREERECALDVRMCQVRYDAMMREVETGERGESCHCWQAVFKD